MRIYPAQLVFYFDYNEKKLVCFNNDLDMFEMEIDGAFYATSFFTSTKFGYYFPAIMIRAEDIDGEHVKAIPLFQKIDNKPIIDYLLEVRVIYIVKATIDEISQFAETRAVPNLSYFSNRQNFRLKFERDNLLANVAKHSQSFHVINDSIDFIPEDVLVEEFYSLIQQYAGTVVSGKK